MFTTTKKDLNDMFGSIDQVVVANVRLLLFAGGKKCNGQAFVTTTSVEGAQKAIAMLDGTYVTDAKGNKRLLKVVPAVSRNVTNKRNNKRSEHNGKNKKRKMNKNDEQ